MLIVQSLLLVNIAACSLLPVCSLQLSQDLPVTVTSKVISQNEDGSCPTNVKESVLEEARTFLQNPVQSILQSGLTIQPSCGEGLWKRVAFLNMSDPAMECPPAWREYSESNVRACGRPTTNSSSCPSTIYTVNNTQYTKVCGRIIGYQYATPGAFHPDGGQQHPQSVDDYYVDGVSLTHGNPRSHIWTFAVGASDGDHPYVCPCTSTAAAVPSPSFIGDNYFCDTAYHSTGYSLDFFPNDPLWDGQGCQRGDCCTFNSPPWFSVRLDVLVATTDDLEVRICHDQGTDDEDTAVGLIELYIQ